MPAMTPLKNAAEGDMAASQPNPAPAQPPFLAPTACRMCPSLKPMCACYHGGPPLPEPGMSLTLDPALPPSPLVPFLT